MTDTPMAQNTFISHLQTSLAKAQKASAGYRRLNLVLVLTSLSSSALGTLITGLTVANGPIIGTGVPGWRISCILAAILGFLTTMSVGLSQQLRVSERLANSHNCSGRLRALELILATQSKPWDLVVQDYETVLREFPDILA